MDKHYIHIYRSSLLIISSEFINTTGCNGRAIRCIDSILILRRTEFLRNIANCLKQNLFGKGSAIYADSTEIKITEGDFVGNTAIQSGGGIYLQYGSIYMHESRFSFNSGQKNYGGALYVLSASHSVSFSWCTLFNNEAYYKGGALFISDSNKSVSMIHTSFYYNTCSQLIYRCRRSCLY